MLPFARILEYGNTIVHAKIKKVQTGNNHVAVLGLSGNLYVRGWNQAGQLGVGDNTNRTTWTLVQSGVADVWCSSTGTVILKSDGTYWSTGYGYIGGSATQTNIFTDRSTEFGSITASAPGSTITNIVACVTSTLALRSDGTLWGIGANSNGEITGTGSRTGTFKQITTPTTPTKIYNGYSTLAYSDAAQGFFYSGLGEGLGSGGSSSARTTFGQYFIGGSSGLKCLDYTGTQFGAFFMVSNLIGGTDFYGGGSQFFGQLADNANGNSTAAVKLMTPVPTGTKLRLFKGYPYYAQSIVMSTGIYGCGQNQSSPYTGKMGVGTTGTVLQYTKGVIDSSIVDFSSAQVYHTSNRTYVLVNDTLYSSGTDTTMSTDKSSTTYVIDSPIL